MAKSTKQTKISKKEQIEGLKKELFASDEIFRRNHEELENQIQHGMMQKGIKIHYQDALEESKSNLRAFEIKLKYGFKVLNPIFFYETTKAWEKHQRKITEYSQKQTQKNLDLILEKVNEVQKDIKEQSERIKSRKCQILDELTKLGVDITKLKDEGDTSYIG